jgi:endonuclease YncB( thermonuclease family)
MLHDIISPQLRLLPLRLGRILAMARRARESAAAFHLRAQGRQRSAASSRLPASAIALVSCLAFSTGIVAQTITDGDTLKQSGITYRLWGIDAPEAKQVCPDGWPAGSLAATRLQALTAGRSIVCQEKDRDRYGRIVAICRVSGEDLGAIMVREGFAWAFTRFSVDYVDQQEEARIANRGVHAHDCERAWEWRARQRTRSGQ